MKRKICVVTGSRAEYGLLYWLMHEIRQDHELELQIIVTGMHLSPEFGWTFRQIEADGFELSAKVEMLLSSDSPVAIAKSMGLGTIGFADALDRLKPDIMVILGDRYEILAAAQAAMSLRIPIAHLHGGETTEGAIDEAIRHSITKMSHLHFVAAEPYQKRVIQLGEHPDRVFNVGAPGLESATRIDFLNRQAIEESLDFQLGPQNFLVTYHPVTLESSSPEKAIQSLLDALDHFSQAHIIFTKQNSDTDGRVIGLKIDEYVQRHPKRTKSFFSLGQLRYLSTLRQVDVVLGNSSSGIIEAPVFHKATVNIGKRQSGRLKADSIIDSHEDTNSIVSAIQQALSEKFQTHLKHVVSPYGAGNVSIKIKEILKRCDLSNIIFKKFYDLPVTR
ncbi:MAG: UDP-N-acetylglucosamine 2-epimerase (hydrolyzing) [SAR324 cluster bacterium]|nr:UDP-N-acetylglucosamine 2-epimerase (hydrolyzing) [SAR324 cluster bacterium]